MTDDNADRAQHVVPLGSLTTGPEGGTLHGLLATDLARQRTTPAFALATPKSDTTCIGPNAEGGHQGGSVAIDLC
jgi:hypothetical protein